MLNLFQQKKKPLNQSYANMSVTPHSQTSVYKAPQNPISSFGQSAISGNGVRAVQSAFKPTLPQAPKLQAPKTNVTIKPNMSVNRPQIQASGMTSQYASNPSNYKPKITPPSVPQVPTTPSLQDPTQKFLQGIDQRTSEKQAFINQQKADQEKSIQDRYGLLGQQISGQLPIAEKNFNVFKDNTLAGVEDIKASGERQKSSAKDYYGDAQRLAAKTLGETKGRDQRTFSNLNTLDSYGEGSFAQANENSTSEFNRFTQQNLKAQADKFAEIDDTVGQAERQATTLISQEEAKLQELTQQIQYALMNNDQAMAEELRGVATQSQQLIFDLQDAVDNLKYEADLEKYKVSLESLDTQGLSDQFLQSGQPQTQADYIYRLKNGDDVNKAFGTSAKPKSSAAVMMETKATTGKRALDTIETEIVNNPNILAQMSIPGSPGARQYEAAVSSITDAIGSLRTGASVSPDQQKFYRNLLPKVGDSPETIQYKLMAVRQELEDYLQGSGTISGAELPADLLQTLGL